MAPSRSKSYRFRITFDAPLPFVYRWCTDFGPGDARLEGEEYARRILERTKRRVVYEDLSDTPNGWYWKRQTVDLHPPDGWSCLSVGNYRIIDLDYTLREAPHGRTELAMVARRTPTGVGGPNPTAKAFGRTMEAMWTNFRKNLEREHRGRPRATRS
jgi:hypothetical protein